jgi:methyl-accepting chemotaxis protein
MADNTGGNNTKKEIDEIGESLKKWASPLEEITNALGAMFTQADAINRAFVDGRVRIQEMDLAVANAASGVIRLGGDITNVSDTIIQIAEGSRRNVIATEEQVSKLYASSKILGTEAGVLVESFGEVGYEVSQIIYWLYPKYWYEC